MGNVVFSGALWIVKLLVKNINFYSQVFHKLLLGDNLLFKEQNRLVRVEARNSVLQGWAPIRADGASGATGYLRVDSPGGSRFCLLGKRKRERESEKDDEAGGEGCRVHRSALRSSARGDG